MKILYARQGDWARRVRFLDQITHGATAWVRKRLSARAFGPKARSPDPIIPPQRCW